MIVLVIIMLAAFAITASPRQATLSGRMVALFCAANCLTYLVAVYDPESMQLGPLRRLIDTDIKIVSDYVITAGLLLALAAYMAFYNRQQLASSAARREIVPIPVPIVIGAIAYATFAALFIWVTLGWETVWSYRGYGVIKDLQDVYYQDPIGMLIAGTFRMVILAVIAMAVFSLRSRQPYLVFFAAFPITAAILLGLAEGSRMTSVYMIVAATCCYLTQRRISAGVCAVLAIVLLGYSLEARAHTALGLAHVPQYLETTIREAKFLLPVVFNISGGLVVTASSVELAVPTAYGLDYKILSLMPTINLIDGFQAAKAVSEQRIASYIPFSAFGEAWAFGPLYYIYLWVVLFFSGYCVNSSMRFGRLWYALLLGGFLLGLVFASQYPLRNALRYFYLLMLARFAIGMFIARYRPQHPLPPRDAAPATHPRTTRL